MITHVDETPVLEQEILEANSALENIIKHGLCDGYLSLQFALVSGYVSEKVFRGVGPSLEGEPISSTLLLELSLCSSTGADRLGSNKVRGGEEVVVSKQLVHEVVGARAEVVPLVVQGQVEGDGGLHAGDEAVGVRDDDDLPVVHRADEAVTREPEDE